MELRAAGLQEQPFRVHGKALVFVNYEAQLAAHTFLQEVYEHSNGLGLFLGPPLSGKSTILREFAETISKDVEVAIVDGSGLNTTALLESVLRQYGFQLDFNCVNELINMLKVLVMQRTASSRTPLLIIENTHALNPSALRVLCELAELQVKKQSALRLVLATDRSIDHLINAPEMRHFSSRLTGEFHLGHLTEDETCDYLYQKLRSGGCFDPENVVPESVADEFYKASGGWPGVLDRLVILALANAPFCPLTKEHIEYPMLPTALKEPPPVKEDDTDAATPAGAEVERPPQLILTSNRQTLKTIELDLPRVIVGRSEHNDLRIESKFISRHHALFIRHGATTFLMDLNSTNGTFVNSKRISNQVMSHNDVITIGNHRIKFLHPEADDTVDLEDPGYTDTVIMKTLQDMRRMLARENTQAIPVISFGKAANSEDD